MNYIEFTLSSEKMMSEDESGLYMALLGDMGFESFREEGRDLFGYITMGDYNDHKEEIDAYLGSLPLSVAKKEIAKENWNALWESNFEPIVVNDTCVVRAPFHPASGVEIEVVIMPKMSFGTGHHQTTRLMMEAILAGDVRGKKCLDMGCGTAVLAILAAMRGAASVDAIDIDEWAYENGLENVAENGVAEIVNLFCGDADLLQEQRYDVIFANINRNILLRDMKRYVGVLNDGGALYMSGFLEEDIDVLLEEASRQGLCKVDVAQKEKWCMLKLTLKK